MRQLLLTFAQSDKMAKVLVAATILPLGCGGKTADDSRRSAAGGASAQGGAANAGGNTSNAGSSAQAGALGTGGGSAQQGGAVSTGGNQVTGGTGACPAYAELESYTVMLPSGATPADAADACNWSGTYPNNVPAARVTLQYDSNSPRHAKGTVVVAPEIAAVQGTVAISSVTADTATISNLILSGQDYTFDVNWDGDPGLGSTVTFQVTLVFGCSPNSASTRQLQTATYVTLCGYSGDLNWVSSGDTCTSCYPMLEVAAQLMPAPERGPDGIALPGDLDIHIVPVAREGRTIVLMLQRPSGTPELSLTWRSSGGQLILPADDVAVWTPPDGPGPHQVQVAAEVGQSASITTYLHRDRA